MLLINLLKQFLKSMSIAIKWQKIILPKKNDHK